jgi:putative phosphoesterase
MKVGILSDTHGCLHPKVLEFLSTCTEIWHAGDIGGSVVLNQLSRVAPVKAVYGNIDDAATRREFPLYQLFETDHTKVLMIHIGGYPKKYDKNAYALIKEHKPALFISGHSHILKVMYDHQNQLLHINPGAAGRYGFHQVITAIRMDLDHGEFKNLEILEVVKS